MKKVSSEFCFNGFTQHKIEEMYQCKQFQLYTIWSLLPKLLYKVQNYLFYASDKLWDMKLCKIQKRNPATRLKPLPASGARFKYNTAGAANRTNYNNTASAKNHEKIITEKVWMEFEILYSDNCPYSKSSRILLPIREVAQCRILWKYQYIIIINKYYLLTIMGLSCTFL